MGAGALTKHLSPLKPTSSLSSSQSSFSSCSFPSPLLTPPSPDENDSLSSDSFLDISSGCLTLRDPAVFRIGINRKVEVDPDPDPELPYLPLMISLNFRSIYNKVESLAEIVKELGVEAIVGVETWERRKTPLSQLLSNTGLTVISKSRQKVRNNQPGGGCCILINPNRFFCF